MRDIYHTTCSIGDLSVQVNFTYVESWPGTNLDPPEPEEVEIEEVLVEERNHLGEVVGKHDILEALSEDAIGALRENCLYHVKYLQQGPEDEPREA